MSAGVGPSCCSWSGNCGGTNQNCVNCNWYVRSKGMYFTAGAYSMSGQVDDRLTLRLIPQTGGAYITAAASAGSAGSWSSTFTVTMAGMYVVGILLNNYEYCAKVSIAVLTTPL